MKNRKLAALLVVVLLFSMVFSVSAFASKDPRTVTPVVLESSVKRLDDTRVLLTCKSDGNPYPLYQWYVLDEDGNWGEVPGAVGSIMIAKGFDSSKTYTFQCVVKGDRSPGFALSTLMTLEAE